MEEQLEQLACRINSEVDKGFERQWIRPREAVMRLRHVKKFQYTPQGIKTCEFDWQDHYAPSWDQACRRVEEAVKKSEEYALVKRLNAFKRDKDSRAYPDVFISHLISHRLYHEKLDGADIRRFIATFIRDVERQPVKCQVKAALEGIVLQPEEISLRVDRISLKMRRTRPQDLEHASASFESLLKLKRIPTAIAEFELPSGDAGEVRERIDQMIAVLRLFKVSFVQCHSYRTQADSITDKQAAGIFYSKPTHRPQGKTLIRSADVERMKKFFQKIARALPPGFYKFRTDENGPISIAYNRYYTALLQEGIFERRVANALMGLESIFLRSRETEDLEYRLSLRIAKVFDCLGFDPYRVKRVVEDAWRIKNTFARGELLLPREKKKLLKKYKTGDFLGMVLNYLRMSIILMLMTFREKDAFLELIDGAFIDRSKETQLNKLVADKFMTGIISRDN